MRSIQTKFITLILACVLLSSVVIGGAGVRIAHTVVDGDSAQIMNLLCSGKASDLDGLFSRIEQSVKTLAVYTSEQLESLERLKTDADYMEAYTSQLRSVAVNAADNTEGALAVYVRFNPEFAPPTSGLFWSRTTRSGSFQELTPTDFSTYSPNDTEHVGWYYIPVNNGAATWMAPYYNQNIGVEMVSYVIPIYRDGETVGVVGMDIDFSVIEDVVNNTQVYDTGYAFLVDAQGMVVCHREIPMGTPMASADKSLAPVVRELQNGTTGSSLFTYGWKGQEKELAFRTLRNSMHLAVTAPVAEIDAARNGLILHILTALLLIAALSVALTVLFTRRLIRPLKELTEAAKKIAAGDYSVTISTRPGHFFLACQMVSAVWMPSRLAGSFLARMMPWREAGSPQTAVGMSRRSGWLSSSTEAKKQFRSQCKITRSPMAAHLLKVNHMFYYTTACAAAQEKNAVP